MKDLYAYTREESVFLARKRWPDSIYCGMRMESRNITFPQTQTILNGINVAGVTLDDIQAVLNMRDAWQYLLEHLDEPLDITYLCALQERVSYREALDWGKLRTGKIGISGVTYSPPVPDPQEAETALAELLAQENSATDRALDVFSWTARSQLFWDGNKRTAILAANKLLVQNGAGVLIVPEIAMTEFSAILSRYYESGDIKRLSGFLYETSIFGLDSVPEHNTEASSKQEKAPAKRTSEWLKQARRQKGFTQRSLAQAIGTATSTISNIEQGQRKGSSEVWEAIEQVLMQ